jgi:hypothetical protein
MPQEWINRIFFRAETALFLSAALLILLQQQFAKPNLKFEHNKVAPPLEVIHLAAGFRIQMADSAWLRSVQDTEYCEKTLENNKCVGQSWFFNIINLVVELDPLFSEAYYYGGLSLTVFIHDVAGASIIFDKATQQFKYEWPILYLAAYHALFEEKDKLKASRLYLAAADNGAPAWVRLSAGKLAASGGDEAAAKEILEQLVKTEADPIWVKQLKEKLKSADSKVENQ